MVKNALKYTLSGTIKFGYKLKGNNLEFYVKDTGYGIPENMLEAVFERFIQTELVTKKALQGTGLGLAIAKAYVLLLGGKIWVVSKEGKGSTFFFTVPYITKQILNPNEKNIESTVDSIVKKNNKINILIVDDDKTSQEILEKFVQDFSKKTIFAENGIEAVELCLENPDLDLIFMDIQMPELSGFDATRRIRQFNKNVIIIAQTAYGLSGDNNLALESGCNDYLPKPIRKITIEMLLQKYFYF